MGIRGVEEGLRAPATVPCRASRWGRRHVRGRLPDGRMLSPSHGPPLPPQPPSSTLRPRPPSLFALLGHCRNEKRQVMSLLVVELAAARL